MTNDEAKALTAALERFTDRADRMLANSGGNANITVNMGGWGVAVSVCAVVVAVVAVFLQGQRISDIKEDVQTDRIYSDAMSRYQDQENKTIRSYIINGKLAPMGAMPKREEKRHD